MSEIIEFPGSSGSVDIVLDQERRQRSERRRRRIAELLQSALVRPMPDPIAERLDAIDERLAAMEGCLS